MMFTVKEEQLVVFASIKQRKDEDRVLRVMERTSPDQYERDGEEKMRTFVQAAKSKGEHYGITDAHDLAGYTLMLVEYGMDFEQAQDMTECLEILENKELTGAAKVDALRKKLKRVSI